MSIVIPSNLKHTIAHYVPGPTMYSTIDRDFRAISLSLPLGRVATCQPLETPTLSPRPKGYLQLSDHRISHSPDGEFPIVSLIISLHIARGYHPFLHIIPETQHLEEDS